uniref:Uncharacterized protein n=1 Tax=Arundo donax TaxID=35708 RepID=A0A0A9FFB6_ARUDO
MLMSATEVRESNEVCNDQQGARTGQDPELHLHGARRRGATNATASARPSESSTGCNAISSKRLGGAIGIGVQTRRDLDGAVVRGNSPKWKCETTCKIIKCFVWEFSVPKVIAFSI